MAALFREAHQIPVVLSIGPDHYRSPDTSRFLQQLGASTFGGNQVRHGLRIDCTDIDKTYNDRLEEWITTFIL